MLSALTKPKVSLKGIKDANILPQLGPYLLSLYTWELNSGQTIWDKAEMVLRTLWELFGNIMRTDWEHENNTKNPSPSPSKRKKTGPFMNAC